VSRFAVTVSTSMPGMVLRLRSCRRPLTMRTVARTVTPINLDRTTLPSSLNRGEPMNAGAVARLRRFPLAISAELPDQFARCHELRGKIDRMVARQPRINARYPGRVAQGGGQVDGRSFLGRPPRKATLVRGAGHRRPRPRSLHDPLASAISNMGERKRGIPRLVPIPGPRRLGVFAKPDKAG